MGSLLIYFYIHCTLTIRYMRLNDVESNERALHANQFDHLRVGPMRNKVITLSMSAVYIFKVEGRHIYTHTLICELFVFFFNKLTK